MSFFNVIVRDCNLFSSGLNTKLVEKTLSHSALHEPLNDPKNGDSAFKHLKQQVKHSRTAKLYILYIRGEQFQSWRATVLQSFVPTLMITSPAASFLGCS